ncbi:MAG: hypothetical protein AAB152_06260 [Candidatus Coatesbacteria bacterium]
MKMITLAVLVVFCMACNSGNGNSPASQAGGEIGGAGWWQGFGAVKHLRVVKDLRADAILDSLQALDTYVGSLGNLPENQTDLVNEIRGTRALVAQALGEAFEAAGKEALAGSGGKESARLRKEAAALRDAASRTVLEIRKRTEEVRRLGEQFRKAARG